MLVFQSIKDIADILLSPLLGIFDIFPDLGYVLTGLGFIAFTYTGWKAIK